MALKRSARRLLERLVGRYGYQLERTDRRSLTDLPASVDVVPRGRHEPFTTDEYDVLPKGRYDFVLSDYGSPVPKLSLLPDELWQRQSDLGGLDLDVDASIGFIEHDLARYVAEIDVPTGDPQIPGEFFLRNACFESVDAELLYAMVRSHRPTTVLELGSGYSSLLINLAARRNADDGVRTAHTAFDPYPRPHVIGQALAAPSSLEPIPATSVPLERIDALEPGDILFVDTTHTVKVGGDVNWIVLDMLPRLKPGVLVHFHDIFLPWEYPKKWFEDMHYYWNEQYLVQAFLAFNGAFETVIAAQAVARAYPERLQRAVPSFGPGVSPGSLWLRRMAASR